MSDHGGAVPDNAAEVDPDTRGVLEVLEGARRSKSDPDVGLVLLVAAVSSGELDPPEALQVLLEDARTD